MKTDIIIKSFNRIYYLDRAIKSIYKNVSGFRKIIILDDGTPEKFLRKLKANFSDIEIRTSNFYKEKSDKIIKNQPVNGMKIPIDFWKEAVKEASQYVVIIEDDVWFSERIDLDILSEEMVKSKCHLLHLGGLDFKYTETFKNESINDFFNNHYSDKLFTANKTIMNLIIENKYKVFSILCRLGFTNNRLIPHYYNYMTIPFGFYNKTFWLYTWQDNKDKANESLLLKNAAAYVNNNRKNKNLICKMKNEILQTTYLVSSTPDYHRYSINFNLFKLNAELNEAWYSDRLDSMHNFPNDLDLNYISSFISKNEDDYNVTLYKKWAKIFTERYSNIKE